MSLSLLVTHLVGSTPLKRVSIRMDTPLFVASSSKFPAAVVIAGVVAEGHLTFDTKAQRSFRVVDPGFWGRQKHRDPAQSSELRQRTGL